MRRPARMQRLYRGALVHELHEAACLAPGDAQRVRHLRWVEPQHQAGSERAGDGAAHRGELQPALGEGAGRGKAQAHEHFKAQDKGAQQATGWRRARLSPRIGQAPPVPAPPVPAPLVPAPSLRA